MTARKIIVTNYPAVGVTQENGEPVTYDMKASLLNLLFHPDLQLTGVDLMKAQELAEKIDAVEDEVLLDSTEYARLQRAIETYKGFTRNEVKLVQRVYDAPEVELEEKV